MRGTNGKWSGAQVVYLLRRGFLYGNDEYYVLHAALVMGLSEIWEASSGDTSPLKSFSREQSSRPYIFGLNGVLPFFRPDGRLPTTSNFIYYPSRRIAVTVIDSP